MEKLKINIFDLAKINKLLVKSFGGAGTGFKDINLAKSSISSCNQEVFGHVLYPRIEDKIAHLVFYIVKNHIFVDGNKRTAVFVLNILMNQYDIKINNLDIKELIINLVTEKVSEDEFACILKNKELIA